MWLGGMGRSGTAAPGLGGGGGVGGGGTPSRSVLMTLDYAYNGMPFCRVEAKPLGTMSLDYAFNGMPFAATQ